MMDKDIQMAEDKVITDEMRRQFRLNEDPDSEEILRKPVRWRHLFSASVVKQATGKAVQSKIRIMSTWSGLRAEYFPDAREIQAAGIILKSRVSYNSPYYSRTSKNPSFKVSISKWPLDLNEELSPSLFECNCPEGKAGEMCCHKAALLYRQEQEEGGLIVVEEDSYDSRGRIRKVRRKKKNEEQARLREEYGITPCPTLDFFQDRKDPKGIVIYDMRTALKGYVTDSYSMHMANDILKNHQDAFYSRANEEKERNGTRTLQMELQVKDSLSDYYFTAGSASITGNRLYLNAKNGYLDGGGNSATYWGEYSDGDGGSESLRAEDSDGEISDGSEDGSDEKRKDGSENLSGSQLPAKNHLNINALLLCKLLWDETDKLVNEATDLTDEKAKKFFSSLEKANQEGARKTGRSEPQREKAVELYPRIIIENGEAKLSFRIQKAGGKIIVLRNVRELVAAYEGKYQLTLTKKESINFGEYDFTDHSAGLYDFLQRKVGDVSDINEQIAARNMYSWNSVRTINVTSNLDLKGAVLDNFYDAWEGQTAEYQDKTNGVTSKEIPVAHRDIRLSLTCDRLSDARGVFSGIAVQGLIPVLLSGSGSYRYTLNADGLSRITEKEQKVMEPFDAVADASGYFRFQVGLSNLQEFYYRVVPVLLESPSVDFRDNCEKEAEGYLPPEPHFDFYLDCETQDFSEIADLAAGKGRKGTEKAVHFLRCTGKVRYREKSREQEKPEKDYTLCVSNPKDGYRDVEQEKRVATAVEKLLRTSPEDDGSFHGIFHDEQLFEFLQTGIATLERYGTVHGSDAFRKFTVTPVPQVRVGVSVDSGILDLSLTSTGISEEELMEVLQSYRRKKRFHVLSSGTFLDLEEDDQLSQISDFMRELDLKPEEVIKKSAKMPLYRALYIDKLLEEHDALYSSRDRVYRGIIRNFKTIRDSESEPPANLTGTLRPYQALGFKWIRTLEEAGFGGILADEMGLGKTLQTISAILYDYDDKKPGTEHPSMVVCPASLVYNWQEEFAKFAPDIRVTPIVGGVAARRQALAAWDTTQVYIISYDLLKRNIAELSGKELFYVVLDEAQYIKNSGAAVSKAVKTLKAAHRLALTGTPIENRLSELWSIFDFLMPGFLYSQKEFEQKYAVPITKNKDQEAMETLKKMTSPFIMRRLKEDVLKDLPAKLEEVRYVPISGEQQKLYDAEVLKLKNSLLDGTIAATGKVQVFAELTKIRQICCDPSLLFENYHEESAKREAVMGLIRQAMDGGHRMLLFSQFTSMLALLEEDLKAEGIPYYILTGSTSKEKRIQLVHQFNEGDVPVFLISLKAGGNGLNLTGADVVIHYDPWWNLAAQNQATDRTHRIGQTRQVTVYRLILKGTIEERILRLQEEKKDLADQVLTGESVSLAGMSQEELLELLG
ncbi:MAG: SNF2 family helicase [Lachnospiraceae bacterium]|nr:SNF2 family helicase [Lachnospiraceae bacterium]